MVTILKKIDDATVSVDGTVTAAVDINGMSALSVSFHHVQHTATANIDVKVQYSNDGTNWFNGLGQLLGTALTTNCGVSAADHYMYDEFIAYSYMRIYYAVTSGSIDVTKLIIAGSDDN